MQVGKDEPDKFRDLLMKSQNQPPRQRLTAVDKSVGVTPPLHPSPLRGAGTLPRRIQRVPMHADD
jgi:hypothetical protein